MSKKLELVNFWKKKANIIDWFRKPKKILTNINEDYQFYNDGTTNIAYNCIKKNINENRGNKKAIIFIDENNKIQSVTYIELENLVDSFIQYLLLNFKKSDLIKNPIGIHSSANLCSAISMLACAKLGITHCVIFNDLSREAIQIRCKIIKCKILITSANNKDIKNKINPIQKKLKLKVLKFGKHDKGKLKINSEKFLLNKNAKYRYNYTKIKSNKASFILFTSGTTGVPKGIVHSTGGYLVYIKYTCKDKFNLNDKKIILTASDAGWINGHTYALYGPLSLGATTILLEKPMILLNEDILKEILLEFKVNILYLPVTLIRLIKSLNSNLKIKSKYLILLGSMGEPLSKYVGSWFSRGFSKKKLQIVNTYFQTETAGIISSPGFKDKISDVPFGSVGKQITKNLGTFIDKKNNKKKGEVKIKYPWPGCMISVINKKEQFKEYWDENKNFKLFDFGSYDKNKNLLIHGRMDDVINIRGHRIGSAEIESVILKSNYIKEVCAIDVDSELSGKELVIFVVNNRKINTAKIIENLILDNFGSFALPKEVISLTELPKTRSGKILRRILRDFYLDPDTNKIGDLSTILNKHVIKEIKKKLNKKNENK
jgi:acetyl-CoA synthetase